MPVIKKITAVCTLALFGLALGVATNAILGSSFGFGSISSPEGVTDIDRFMRYRQVGSLLLVVQFAVPLACYFIGKTNQIRHKTVAVLTFPMCFVYSFVTTAVLPEISPLQFFTEGLPSKTEYSPDFSLKHFLNVAVGMTKEEVQSLIGTGFAENIGNNTWF